MLRWVDYEFDRLDLGNLEKDYVLGTDKTAHVEHYFRYANDRLRKKLEAQGITITSSHSTSKAEFCWVEFNLNQITEYKKA
jgi:GDP-D-mannose dehydratase